MRRWLMAQTPCSTPENANVLSWKREGAGGPPVVVAVNFTADPQTVNLVGAGLPDSPVTTLLKTPGAPDSTSLKAISSARSACTSGSSSS